MVIYTAEKALEGQYDDGHSVLSELRWSTPQLTLSRRAIPHRVPRRNDIMKRYPLEKRIRNEIRIVNLIHKLNRLMCRDFNFWERVVLIFRWNKP